MAEPGDVGDGTPVAVEFHVLIVIPDGVNASDALEALDLALIDAVEGVTEAHVATDLYSVEEGDNGMGLNVTAIMRLPTGGDLSSRVGMLPEGDVAGEQLATLLDFARHLPEGYSLTVVDSVRHVSLTEAEIDQNVPLLSPPAAQLPPPQQDAEVVKFKLFFNAPANATTTAIIEALKQTLLDAVDGLEADYVEFIGSLLGRAGGTRAATVIVRLPAGSSLSSQAGALPEGSEGGQQLATLLDIAGHLPDGYAFDSVGDLQSRSLTPADIEEVALRSPPPPAPPPAKETWEEEVAGLPVYLWGVIGAIVILQAMGLAVVVLQRRKKASGQAYEQAFMNREVAKADMQREERGPSILPGRMSVAGSSRGSFINPLAMRASISGGRQSVSGTVWDDFWDGKAMQQLKEDMNSENV